MQVFQAKSLKRWKVVTWSLIVIATVMVLLILTPFISLLSPGLPELPKLKPYTAIVDPANVQRNRNEADSLNRALALSSEDREDTVPFSFGDHQLSNPMPPRGAQQVKAAFYVNWDPQSFYSLRENVDKINTVMPEWFFLNNSPDSISINIDNKALALIKAHQLRIIPILSNFFMGHWDGGNVHRIITDQDARRHIINSICSNLVKYRFQGINVDFEDLTESTDEYIIIFQNELYAKLHKAGLLVTQDIQPGNADFNVNELQKYNDYLVIMAYDQHSVVSKPGSISAIKWVEKVMLGIEVRVAPSKIILGLSCDGYDWPGDSTATDLGFNKAMSTALERKVIPVFNKATHAVHYQYSDDSGMIHQVYFNDAITVFNIMRLGSELSVAGFALWRLGVEDSRLWKYYDRRVEAIHGADFQALDTGLAKISPPKSVVYTGEGEILNLVGTPAEGKVDLAADTENRLITDETYLDLPRGYYIEKNGDPGGKKIVLSFDDGPDRIYTPQIIDILLKEKIPASFFLLGNNCLRNIPLVKHMHALGFELGSHSFFHPDFSHSTKSRIRFELRSTRRLLECINGQSCILYRSPYCSDEFSEAPEDIYPISVARAEHYYSVGSSIDPRDWEAHITAGEILRRVIKAHEEGNVILLHDGGGNRAETVKSLPAIIHYFKSQGYTFTTFSDLLGKTTKDIMPEEHGFTNTIFRHVNYLFVSVFYYSWSFWEYLFVGGLILFFARTLFVITLAMIQKNKSDPADRLDPLFGNPPVSIIIPAHNEEVTILKTVNNLLDSDYEHLEIIVVDDGSTDQTFNIFTKNFGDKPKVRILQQENEGKALALSYGIEQSCCDYVFCIDADTLLDPAAISRMIGYFSDERVVAVSGNVKVGNEKNWLTTYQSIEYITSQNFDRRAFEVLNCIPIIPGAIGAFRKPALMKAGGFTPDTMAEDCDLTMRLLRDNGIIKYCSTAYSFTEAPENVNMFLKQRLRWTFGIMQSFWKHHRSFLNPKAKALGFVAMPNMLIFQFLLPVIAPIMDLLFFAGLIHHQTIKVLVYYALFLLIDFISSLLAFSFEKESKKRLWHLVPQRFVYRQLMAYVMIKSILRALKGDLMHWCKIERSGNVKVKPQAVGVEKI